MLEHNQKNMKLLRMNRRKTDLDFHSLEYLNRTDEDVEDISLEDCVTSNRMSRSNSSKELFLGEQSSILHGLGRSLGLTRRTASLGRPWKIVVEPWTKTNNSK